MSLLPALLMLHLIALILMAGTTVIEFLNYKTFWKLLDYQKEQAIGVLTATSKVQRLIGIGAGLLIITGVGMIALTHGLFAQQLWFKIKIIFVLLLIANGILNGNRLAVKVSKIIHVTSPENQVLKLKSKLGMFHVVQFCIFLIVIFLSAYKFN